MTNTNEPIESHSSTGSDAGNTAEPARGWGGSEIVRDHSGQATEDGGWDSERVVRDQGEDDEAEGEKGWSAGEVVRDQGTAPTPEQGGWSAGEMVRDHGDPDAAP